MSFNLLMALPPRSDFRGTGNISLGPRLYARKRRISSNGESNRISSLGKGMGGMGGKSKFMSSAVRLTVSVTLRSRRAVCQFQIASYSFSCSESESSSSSSNTSELVYPPEASLWRCAIICAEDGFVFSCLSILGSYDLCWASFVFGDGGVFVRLALDLLRPSFCLVGGEKTCELFTAVGCFEYRGATLVVGDSSPSRGLTEILI